MRCGLLIGALALAPALGLGAACEDTSHGDIGDEINILVRRGDAATYLLIKPSTK